MPIDLPTTPRRTRRRLRPHHAEVVGKTLFPMVGFLGRLQRRLEANGFGPADRLYQAAAAAYDAVFTLNVFLHYDSCEREPPPEPPRDWVI